MRVVSTFQQIVDCPEIAWGPQTACRAVLEVYRVLIQLQMHYGDSLAAMNRNLRTR